MFLKNARSLLKVDGIRTEFLGKFPICPRAVGKVKQPTLITYFEPVLSTPVAPFVGSHVKNALALTVPPVKSVIIVHTVADVWNVPKGQVCPDVIVAVPDVYE